MNKNPSIALLVCGGLGLEALQSLNSDHSITFVFTDSKSLSVIQYCKTNAIPFFSSNPRRGSGANFLNINQLSKPDILFSINYKYIIEDDIFNFCEIIALNVHGSLLPKYRGRTPLIWAIINGEEKTGITIHEIDAGCDTGGIILQQEVTIPVSATGHEMIEVFKTLYTTMVRQSIQLIKSGSYKVIKQIEKEATFYGRRTPEDGEINWEWSSSRIYNWVRALSPPYPGAFSYVCNQKFIIEKVTKIEHPFSPLQKNGTVIGFIANSPIIKCQDGCILVEKHDPASHLKINHQLTGVKYE